MNCTCSTLKDGFDIFASVESDIQEDEQEVSCILNEGESCKQVLRVTHYHFLPLYVHVRAHTTRDCITIPSNWNPNILIPEDHTRKVPFLIQLDEVPTDVDDVNISYELWFTDWEIDEEDTETVVSNPKISERIGEIYCTFQLE